MTDKAKEYLETKMPWLFIDGKLINENNLPTHAKMYVEAFDAGRKSALDFRIKLLND